MKAFLSHNFDHKPAVEEVARRLREEGIDPWLDKWNLIPGEPWQAAIEEALQSCDSCLVFIGPGGLGPWQNEEMRRAIDRRVNEGKKIRVVPVLLPGTDRPDRGQLPSFLVATTWVEFRDTLDDKEAFRLLPAELVCEMGELPVCFEADAPWVCRHLSVKDLTPEASPEFRSLGENRLKAVPTPAAREVHFGQDAGGDLHALETLV